jgi:hypothetical protein
MLIRDKLGCWRGGEGLVLLTCNHRIARLILEELHILAHPGEPPAAIQDCHVIQAG